MSSLFNARSVDPSAVTIDDIAEIMADYAIDTTRPGPEDFFQPGRTYRRIDVFRCVAVGWQPNGDPAALGYLPVNLSDGPAWEFAFLASYDWTRGWTEITNEQAGA